MLEIKKIFIASDHAGFQYKKNFILKNTRYHWEDLGVFKDSSPCSYPDQAKLLCEHLLKSFETGGEECYFGVLICGSGQGMAMSANRFSGIRAALVWDQKSCTLAREHNNANVLCLGSRVLPFDLANSLFHTFITTAFKGGRHRSRLSRF